MTRDQEALQALYGEIVRLTKELTTEERVELTAWENAHLDGSGLYGTTDWPGWRAKLSPEGLQTLEAMQARCGRGAQA